MIVLDVSESISVVLVVCSLGCYLECVIGVSDMC